MTPSQISTKLKPKHTQVQSKRLLKLLKDVTSARIERTATATTRSRRGTAAAAPIATIAAQRRRPRRLAERLAVRSAAPSADPAAADPRKPEAEVQVTAIDSDVRRGLPLRLQGQVGAAGRRARTSRSTSSWSAASSSARLAVAPPERGRIGRAAERDSGVALDNEQAVRRAVVIPRDLSLGETTVVVTPRRALRRQQ